ncbi:hypothetical protein E2C01_035515 [Portunus trituberculatus]|uniref:Uncharacterized protein n=1 Tax=Portunus trituberculatus TaxID=210409 RepID=A0A5B7F9D3_PORTR|nr:hypothetical protein [Portunus trituberculatus]
MFPEVNISSGVYTECATAYVGCLTPAWRLQVPAAAAVAAALAALVKAGGSLGALERAPQSHSTG